MNDSCGHDAGDKIIIGAARCIEQCFGSECRLYRIGGDVTALAKAADEKMYEEKVR